MKRTIYICTLMIVMACSVTASAQVRFGVKGGVSLNSLKFRNWSDVREAYNQRLGFNVGVTLEVGVPVTGLAVQASALYNRRSVEEDNTGRGYLKRDLLAVPVYVKYSLIPNALVTPYVFTGPEFTFRISDRYDRWNNQFSSYTTSWHFGAGLEILRHVRVSVAYGLGLNSSIRQAWTDSQARSNIAKGTDRFWDVGVGYMF